MSTDSKVKFEDSKEAKRYSSFPDKGITDKEYRALRNDKTLKEVYPVAGFPSEDRITHFGFIYDGFHRIVGWDPESEEWLQIFKMPKISDADKQAHFEAASIFNDEEVVLHFEQYIENEEFTFESLYEFLGDYIHRVYGEDNSPIIFH